MTNPAERDEMPQLDNPPIVEAVVDVDCDMPIGFDLEEAAGEARDRLADEYPQQQQRYAHQGRLSFSLGTPARLESASRELDAFLFRSADTKQVVQIRRTGYSFNRLAPYHSFDAYLPEIRRTWEHFCDAAKPVQVRMLRMRYINRIKLPAPDGSVALQRFLRIGPQLPDPDSFLLTGFLDQRSAVERGTGNRSNTVLTGEPGVEGHIPIIFDNGVEADLETTPADWESIERKLRDLRALKNRVFGLTLTRECLNLFQRSSDSV